MRWLLVAGLFCLPMAGGCAGGACEMTDEETVEEPAMKFKCADCGKESGTADDCCGATMAEME